MTMKMVPRGWEFDVMHGRALRHPRLATLDAQVCVVECYDARFTRVFGPYPRAEAVKKRERWMRRATGLWHYEFWEDLEDTEARLERVEPHYRKEDRWNYLLEQIAHETAPVYVVRIDPRGPPPYPIVETFFGPVPRRVGNNAMVAGGVLDWVGEMAQDSVFSQPPSGTAKDARTVWTSEWLQGAESDLHGPKGSDVPPEAEWPSWPELEDEPEYYRGPGPA